MSQTEIEIEESTKFSNQVTPDMPEWQQWLKICDYTRWNPHGPLVPMKFHGKIIPHSGKVGVTPRFFNELVERIRKVKPIRMAIVGEAGVSKTYTAIEIAKTLNKNFTVDNIVFKGVDYMKLVRKIQWGMPIVLEEPTFHLAARTWYREWQQIVVQTIESTRFQNNPLFIPVVNRNLLDKTVREYYINYVVNMFDRGIGRAYRCKHSQWQDYVTRGTAFNIYVYSPAIDLLECGRETCLECPELQTCEKTIWAKYERRRAEAIEFYQTQGEQRLIEADTRHLSFKQMVDLILAEPTKYMNSEGIIIVENIMYHLNIKEPGRAKKILTAVEEQLMRM